MRKAHSEHMSSGLSSTTDIANGSKRAAACLRDVYEGGLANYEVLYQKSEADDGTIPLVGLAT
jgi:hypothetical protein